MVILYTEKKIAIECIPCNVNIQKKKEAIQWGPFYGYIHMWYLDKFKLYGQVPQ